jgi:hypothetical protein
VFQKLLKTVPHLEERLMECSNEEAMAMADLVCLFDTYCFVFIKSVTAPERRLKCQVRRYQESEGRRAGLDNSPRRPVEPATCAQCQDEPWLSSQRYGSTPLSRRRGLE